MQIRLAGAEDWEAVRDLRLEARRTAPLAFGSTVAQEQDRSAEDWTRWIATADVFLAEDDGVPRGLASAVDNGDGSTSVFAMYVTPAARGCGLSHRLLDAVVTGCRDRGGSRLLLHLADGNPAAAGSYAAYGFTPTGRRQPLPHAPHVGETELSVDIAPSD